MNGPPESPCANEKDVAECWSVVMRRGRLLVRTWHESLPGVPAQKTFSSMLAGVTWYFLAHSSLSTIGTRTCRSTLLALPPGVSNRASVSRLFFVGSAFHRNVILTLSRHSPAGDPTADVGLVAGSEIWFVRQANWLDAIYFEELCGWNSVPTRECSPFSKVSYHLALNHLIKLPNTVKMQHKHGSLSLPPHFVLAISVIWYWNLNSKLIWYCKY